MTDRSKHIARQWNREIEDQIRRAGARDPARQPWRTVSWIALWLFWLAVLVALIVRANPLG